MILSVQANLSDLNSLHAEIRGLIPDLLGDDGGAAADALSRLEELQNVVDRMLWALRDKYDDFSVVAGGKLRRDVDAASERVEAALTEAEAAKVEAEATVRNEAEASMPQHRRVSSSCSSVLSSLSGTTTGRPISFIMEDREATTPSPFTPSAFSPFAQVPSGGRRSSRSVTRTASISGPRGKFVMDLGGEADGGGVTGSYVSRAEEERRILSKLVLADEEETQLRLLRERGSAISGVNQSMRVLNQTFKDVSELVEGQSGAIDNIERNAEETEGRARAGLMSMQRAAGM